MGTSCMDDTLSQHHVRSTHSVSSTAPLAINSKQAVHRPYRDENVWGSHAHKQGAG